MTNLTTESSSENISNENNLVEIKNLSAGYAGVAVIRGVNLQVEKAR
ncbi:MAG: hypothetical protein Ct9H90mP5_10840 [Acidimicrobiaceae bacterium]|nr:MAG: hypothetical protein Ct9H90mP5_10840 [Acidimicrobiaceae bacterium]